MLVGDYCPRALDPVFLLKDAFLEEVDEILGKAEKEIVEDLKKEFGSEEPTEKNPKEGKEEKEVEESSSSSSDEDEKEVKEPEKPKVVPKKEAPRLRSTEPTELPCNVFGTVDRCDGMACEHDGNCYSGCCSLFVSGEQKRCMPMVNGDMCPIAIDIVQHDVVEEVYYESDHRIVEKEPAPEQEY